MSSLVRRLPQISKRIGNATRFRSTIATSYRKAPFWTPGRVLLLTTFTGSLTYLYGVNDGRFSRGPKKPAFQIPSYGTKNDMEKVDARNSRPENQELTASQGN
jgi:D-lactate dehydrogenase (cytochrome)